MWNYWELIVIIFFGLFLFSFLSLAPWVPTKTSDLKRINKLLQLKKWEKFLEIGCGTAKVSLFLAKNNPESEIIGIELSPFFYAFSKTKVFLSRQKNIKIIYGNALKMNYSPYDVVYVFGLPETISQKLFPKLREELQEKSRFVSYCFQMTNNYFSEKKHKESKGVNSIYIYSHKS